MARTPAACVLLTASLVWCLAILAAPLGPSAPVYTFFSFICHQNPSRSWSLMGEPLPVCIRCASIYFGFLISLIAGFPPRAQWLRMAIVLSLGEFILGHLLLDSAVLRSLTGVALGATAAPFVRQGIEEMQGTIHELL